MSTDTRADALERRIHELYATDEQFAAARPDEAVSAAIERPGLRRAHRQIHHRPAATRAVVAQCVA
jgi:hypothetical protein